MSTTNMVGSVDISLVSPFSAVLRLVMLQLSKFVVIFFSGLVNVLTLIKVCSRMAGSSGK